MIGSCIYRIGGSRFPSPFPSLPPPPPPPPPPHSSLLTPHSSLLTPHSSLLTPHSSPNDLQSAYRGVRLRCGLNQMTSDRRTEASVCCLTKILKKKPKARPILTFKVDECLEHKKKMKLWRSTGAMSESPCLGSKFSAIGLPR